VNPLDAYRLDDRVVVLTGASSGLGVGFARAPAAVGAHQGYQEVVDTRVAGLLGGVTLAERLSAESVSDELIEHGFITRPLRGNTVQISPPFITTAGEIRRLVAALGTVIWGAPRSRPTEPTRSISTSATPL
jgi:adenosylmethionine-8-amino-7-oxononanoate aminotransferase